MATVTLDFELFRRDRSMHQYEVSFYAATFGAQGEIVEPVGLGGHFAVVTFTGPDEAITAITQDNDY
jgi:hypothetical protein